MKRYRVFAMDFDSRAIGLDQSLSEDWPLDVQERWKDEREKTLKHLKLEFGEDQFEAKLANYVALGPKRFSVVAFHNLFFEQVRRAFVIGAYYPALVGACALGERILNHLILALRDDFTSSLSYKNVYNKDSFDNWSIAIGALIEWSVLTADAAEGLRKLERKRHESVHFRPEVDTESRTRALEAIGDLGWILEKQFGADGPLPWFLHDIPGEIYIKGEWVNHPFVAKIYLRSCGLVGPWHQVESVLPHWKIRDNFDYDDREVSDEEFVGLRKQGPVAS